MTKETVKVDVHHITRVEGHGNIVVDVHNGELKKCELQITETPRFFEAMLRGRPFNEASHLTSRICGICAVVHATTSLRATETALGVDLSEQTIMLRKLNLHGEILDSHLLHVYMLVAPDLLGVGSVFPLAKSSPDVVLRALRMKKLAGDICATVCGRHTHPIAMTVGGFTHFPTIDELIQLRHRLEAVRADVDATIELFQSLSLPSFDRETEYIALHKEDEYCYMDGELVSSDSGVWSLDKYRQVTNEYMVPHSTAKRTRNQRSEYMVGALARFNINHDKLHPRAQAAAAALNLKPKCINPYLISIAQVVEIVHSVEEAILLIDQLLDRGVTWEDPMPPTRLTGEGVGSCEAPRGTLFHHYCIEDGLVVNANCIIPTAQNLANIEADMHALVPTILDKKKSDITLTLEMLVRAYDPCISCSTHILNVKFI